MVRVTYLEMTSKDQLVKRGPKRKDIEVRECIVKQYQLNKFLYEYVGGDWNWTEKLDWSAQQWQRYACDENMRTFAAYKQGSIAGFYELQRQDGGDVQILSLGLTPEFIGQGYGRFLVTRAIEDAWSWDAKRVWLHTCTNDHPNALNNYLKSGLKIYKVEEKQA